MLQQNFSCLDSSSASVRWGDLLELDFSSIKWLRFKHGILSNQTNSDITRQFMLHLTSDYLPSTNDSQSESSKR